MTGRHFVRTLAGLLLVLVIASFSFAQQGSRAVRARDGVRAVTIPVTIQTADEVGQTELRAVGNLKVLEDGDEQRVLSIRSYANSPISLAILVQDGIVSSINYDILKLGDFVRRLPRGSRVLVGYMRGGSVEIRQKFTTDLNRAAGALRVPVNFASAGPASPYQNIIEALRRYEPLPAGRRAMIVISDGVDHLRATSATDILNSIDLERAVREAQNKGVAIYSIYAPSSTTAGLGSTFFAAASQGALQRLSSDTGGRAYFQGTGAPVSIDPFIRDISLRLTGQLAVTYLSTHNQKGFHRIEVVSDRKGIKIDHPGGYTR